MTASDLDPHITLESAEFQLERVVTALVACLKRDPTDLKQEIDHILKNHSQAAFGGLAGEQFVNVLELNLELYNRYGGP